MEESLVGERREDGGKEGEGLLKRVVVVVGILYGKASQF